MDKAGFEDVQIMASNSLDEYIIQDTLVQGAEIYSFLKREEAWNFHTF